MPSDAESRMFTGLIHPAFLRAAIFLAFCVLVLLAFTRNVNWDEFYFLSLVHAYLDGRLDRPLQTFHVHFFGWLAALPGDEMTQITAARLIMTVLLGLTAASIWRIARSFPDHNNQGAIAALIAVLAYLTSGFVLPHGASFRADPIAAALLMSALAILMTGRLSALKIGATAVLGALALVITIKSVLYVPAILGALIWRSSERGMWMRFLLAALAALLLAACLFMWHSAGVQAGPGKDSVSNASDALSTTLLHSRLVPRLAEVLMWLFLSFSPIMLALIGVVQAHQNRLRVTLVFFMLPTVLSVIFYRNAFAYFFPFIVPPLIVAVAVGVAQIRPASRLRIYVALMLIAGFWQAQNAVSEGSIRQRQIIAEVHRLFPKPVHYIDQNAMIASFPRETFFMSTWGIAQYRAQGRPVMADLIARTAPPLLLTGRRKLHLVMTDPMAATNPALLLPEDIKVLRESYVHYAGAIWLAGREVTLGDDPLTLTIPMPGRYRIESPVEVTVDGILTRDGDVIDLVGTVTLSGAKGSFVRLIWDTGVSGPPPSLPEHNLYAAFLQI